MTTNLIKTMRLKIKMSRCAYIPTDGMGVCLERVGEPEASCPCQMARLRLHLAKVRVHTTVRWEGGVLEGTKVCRQNNGFSSHIVLYSCLANCFITENARYYHIFCNIKGEILNMQSYAAILCSGLFRLMYCRNYSSPKLG